MENNTIHEEDIDQLLESEFDINSKDENGATILHRFTKKGDIAGVKSLLEHEADFNATDNEDRSPLHYAIIHRHKKIAKLLVNHLTINSSDKNGFTPLHLAALQDDTELIDFLIDNGAEINERDAQEGCTPLHIATLYGSKKVFSFSLITEQILNVLMIIYTLHYLQLFFTAPHTIRVG